MKKNSDKFFFEKALNAVIKINKINSHQNDYLLNIHVKTLKNNTRLHVGIQTNTVIKHKDKIIADCIFILEKNGIKQKVNIYNIIIDIINKLKHDNLNSQQLKELCVLLSSPEHETSTFYNTKFSIITKQYFKTLKEELFGDKDLLIEDNKIAFEIEELKQIILWHNILTPFTETNGKIDGYSFYKNLLSKLRHLYMDKEELYKKLTDSVNAIIEHKKEVDSYKERVFKNTPINTINNIHNSDFNKLYKIEIEKIKNNNTELLQPLEEHFFKRFKKKIEQEYHKPDEYIPALKFKRKNNLEIEIFENGSKLPFLLLTYFSNEKFAPKTRKERIAENNIVYPFKGSLFGYALEINNLSLIPDTFLDKPANTTPLVFNVIRYIYKDLNTEFTPFLNDITNKHLLKNNKLTLQSINLYINTSDTLTKKELFNLYQKESLFLIHCNKSNELKTTTGQSGSFNVRNIDKETSKYLLTKNTPIINEQIILDFLKNSMDRVTINSENEHGYGIMPSTRLYEKKFIDLNLTRILLLNYPKEIDPRSIRKDLRVESHKNKTLLTKILFFTMVANPETEILENSLFNNQYYLSRYLITIENLLFTNEYSIHDEFSNNFLPKKCKNTKNDSELIVNENYSYWQSQVNMYLYEKIGIEQKKRLNDLHIFLKLNTERHNNATYISLLKEFVKKPEIVNDFWTSKYNFEKH
ncbi:hypothetical protein [Polaribacter sp. OB-PA-B3]